MANTLTEQLGLVQVSIAKGSFGPFMRSVSFADGFSLEVFRDGKYLGSVLSSKDIDVTNDIKTRYDALAIRAGDTIVRISLGPRILTLNGKLYTKDGYIRDYEAVLELQISNPGLFAQLYQQNSDPILLAKVSIDGMFQNFAQNSLHDNLDELMLTDRAEHILSISRSSERFGLKVIQVHRIHLKSDPRIVLKIEMQRKRQEALSNAVAEEVTGKLIQNIRKEATMDSSLIETFYDYPKPTYLLTSQSIINSTQQRDDNVGAAKSMKAIKIFYSYAHEDEALRNQLNKHLASLRRQGLISEWYDRNISAGIEWESEISEHLNTSKIILLLVSPDFMNSDYCYSTEMNRAMERHKRGEARVIPIILRHVLWRETPLGKLKALPTDGKPATDPYWHDLDRAFFDVAEGIRKVVEELNT